MCYCNRDFIKKKGNTYYAHCHATVEKTFFIYPAMLVLYAWPIFQGICKEGMDTEPVNTDVGSEISSQSELTSSNRPLNL